MLWKIELIGEAFIQEFEPAGEPDQSVIDAYRAQHPPRSSTPAKHAGVKRWYYLSRTNPRIRLATIGRPLSDWAGAAKVIVGINEIIGEFPGNLHLVGQQGLFLQMQPIEWLQGEADLHFSTGTEALESISEQILDRKAIKRSQQEIKTKYEHQRPGFSRKQQGQHPNRRRNFPKD